MAGETVRLGPARRGAGLLQRSPSLMAGETDATVDLAR